ncbi:MAG: glutamate--cysteine ligase [Deltaproteobacteria bacterium]|nr:glutamate--cysteine ligase [Deltaproteobacteria bacterium]MBN2674841.1 glutamate--cysteine ligase [Deltaproteobacteria bacterium]
MNTRQQTRHLFEAYGLELEYMIVNRNTFDVMPISDWLLSQVGEPGAREVEQGSVAWSNELAMHVIELKGNGPVSHLSTLTNPLKDNIKKMNQLLGEKNACLMGSAVHPWMNPDTDTALWLFEDAPIYAALDKTFGCRGHGWFNLQSAHLNLPFANDEEFAKLHAAIRIILPIIPAIAAASPYLDAKDTGVADARLLTYAEHCNRLPEAIGDVIPEPVDNQQQYEDIILSPLYAALKKREPEGVLQYEWSNARGAIARFDRNTIEVRLIDVQEHPGMDMGVVGAVSAAVQLLSDDRRFDWAALNAVPTKTLKGILDDTIRQGEHTLIQRGAYLGAVCDTTSPCTAKEVWQCLLERCPFFAGPPRQAAEWVVAHGTLASRMRNFVKNTGDENLKKLAGALCASLEKETALFDEEVDAL